MPNKVPRVFIDSSGNFQYYNVNAVPTPRAQLDFTGRARTDCDIWQFRDEAQNILWWVDKTGTPHFPNDGTGVLPTHDAVQITGVPGVQPTCTILEVLNNSGVVIGFVSVKPGGGSYGRTLLSSFPS
jgi:hypothetical protein